MKASNKREAQALALEHEGEFLSRQKGSVSFLEKCLQKWESGGERLYLAWNVEKNRQAGHEIWNTSSSNGTKIWFRCNKGHEWQARLCNIQWGTWCPKCNTRGTSYPEQVLYQWLSENFKCVQNRAIIGGCEADVVIEDEEKKVKLIIEYQGEKWHRNSLKKDYRKVKKWKLLGYKVLWATSWKCEKYRSVSKVSHDALRDTECTDLIQKVRGYLREEYGISHLTPLKGRQREQALIDSRRVVYEKSFEYYCKKDGRDKLLAEWNNSKNTLSPSEVMRSTRQKVWWKCADCGTEYEGTVHARFYDNKKCPRCRNRKSKDKAA